MTDRNYLLKGINFLIIIDCLMIAYAFLFQVQGGMLKVTGEVSVENTAKGQPTTLRVDRRGRAQLGSLKINNETIAPVSNLKKLVTTDSKLINKGVLQIENQK